MTRTVARHRLIDKNKKRTFGGRLPPPRSRPVIGRLDTHRRTSLDATSLLEPDRHVGRQSGVTLEEVAEGLAGHMDGAPRCGGGYEFKPDRQPYNGGSQALGSTLGVTGLAVVATKAVHPRRRLSEAGVATHHFQRNSSDLGLGAAVAKIGIGMNPVGSGVTPSAE